jgi:hypothetical protein
MISPFAGKSFGKPMRLAFFAEQGFGILSFTIILGLAMKLFGM